MEFSTVKVSHFPFYSTFFSSHGVPFPLSTCPASESLCPTTMIVNLGFAKLFPYFSPSFFKLTPPLLGTACNPIPRSALILYFNVKNLPVTVKREDKRVPELNVKFSIVG